MKLTAKCLACPFLLECQPLEAPTPYGLIKAMLLTLPKSDERAQLISETVAAAYKLPPVLVRQVVDQTEAEMAQPESKPEPEPERAPEQDAEDRLFASILASIVLGGMPVAGLRVIRL